MKIEKVIGDEPTKYFDSKTSREESTQKRFYMKGLHKKQGRFSRAVNHLIENQDVEGERDCENDAVDATSCNKIDMSGIDFGIKKKLTSLKPQKQREVLTPQDTTRSDVDNSPVTSEMESKLLNKNVKKPTSILYEGREESELID